MTKCRYPGNIVVGGMQLNFPDMLRFRQTQVFPVLSFVGRFVNTNTCIGRTAAVHFAGSHPNDPGRRIPVHGNIPDKKHIDTIKNRSEALTIVSSVPQAARGIRHIKFGGIFRVHVYIYNAATHHTGANTAKFYIVDNGFFFQTKTLF